jgi:hypothetical protein
VLECGATDIERKIQIGAGILDEGDHLRRERLERAIAAHQPSARELLFKHAHELLRLVAEKDRANALDACRDEDQAERALADGELDLGVAAARAELAWTHAENLRRICVEAAVRVEARTIDCFRYRCPARELLANALVAMGGGVRLGRHAGQGFEDSVEMIGAQARVAGQLIELRFLFRRLDQPAGFGDGVRMLVGEGRLVRLAALACAEAGCFGVGSRRVKAHILALGTSSRAGWPAINAGRLHRDNELPVEGNISRHEGDPARLITLMRWPPAPALNCAVHCLCPCRFLKSAPEIVLAGRFRTPILAVKQDDTAKPAKGSRGSANLALFGLVCREKFRSRADDQRVGRLATAASLPA